MADVVEEGFLSEGCTFRLTYDTDDMTLSKVRIGHLKETEARYVKLTVELKDGVQVRSTKGNVLNYNIPKNDQPSFQWKTSPKSAQQQPNGVNWNVTFSY